MLNWLRKLGSKEGKEEKMDKAIDGIKKDLHYTYQSNMDQKSVCKCLLGYSFLLSCRIEVLKINQFRGHIGEMVQIKHVLEKLPCLELLEVHVQRDTDYQKKLQIMADLQILPRASSKCKVQVKFS